MVPPRPPRNAPDIEGLRRSPRRWIWRGGAPAPRCGPARPTGARVAAGNSRELSDQIQETLERRLHAPDTGAEETAAARFASGLRETYWVRVRAYRVKYLIKGIGNFFAKFGPFALLLFGGWLIIARPGSFHLGSLVAVLAAYERLDEPWQELLDYYQRQEIARVRYRQVISAFEASGPRVGVPA